MKTEMPLSVLNPILEVKFGDKTIEVRELMWPDALQFYAKLRAQKKNIIDGEGNLVLSAATILEVVNENIELAQWLVLKSTGKEEAWLNELTMSQMLELVTAALEVNLSVISSKIKNAQSRLGGMLGGAMMQK